MNLHERAENPLELEELFVSSTQNAELLSKAILQLSSAERVLLALRFFEGLTIDEITETLGISSEEVLEVQTKALLRLFSSSV